MYSKTVFLLVINTLLTKNLEMLITLYTFDSVNILIK